MPRTKQEHAAYMHAYSANPEAKAKRKQYLAANAEKIAARQKAYRAAHQEQIAAVQKRYDAKRQEQRKTERATYQRKWRADNRERLLAEKRAWQQAHQAEIAEKRRIHRAAADKPPALTKAEVIEKKRAYYQAHKAEIAAKVRARRLTQPPEDARARKLNHRARQAGAVGSLTGAEIRAIRDWFGNACLACGTSDGLTVDHVVPFAAGGSNSILNTQPLCKPCNLRKGKKTTDYRDPARLAAFAAACQLAGNPDA